jgi:hypothetical protein
MPCAGSNCGDSQLATNHGPGVEIVVACTVAQLVQVDKTIGIARKCKSPAAVEQGLEAQLELVGIDHFVSPDALVGMTLAMHLLCEPETPFDIGDH